MVLDSGSVPVSCKDCGREFIKTIAWIKRNPHFSCVCGVTFEAEEFLRSLKESERLLDKLGRSGDLS